MIGGTFETKNIQASIKELQRCSTSPEEKEALETISTFIKNSITYYEILLNSILQDLEDNDYKLHPDIMEELKDATSKDTQTALEYNKEEKEERFLAGPVN